jgi:hypothetical protein
VPDNVDLDLLLKTRRLADSESFDSVKFALHGIDLISDLMPYCAPSYKTTPAVVIDCGLDLDETLDGSSTPNAAGRHQIQADDADDAELPLTINFRPYDWLDVDLMSTAHYAFVRGATNP